jgi:hypothetical protein
VTELKRFSQQQLKLWRCTTMALIVAIFLGLVARFYVPGKGFSALIIFGGNYVQRYIPELKSLPYFTDEQSFGYDAQWYAQIAMRPDPRDPEMMSAVDNLPYRARRILFCWTAYLFGFGQPAWILQVFALQNVICWLALAWLALRWFPPDRWENVFRWAAVLFSFGLCLSVRASLVDGPSLLLIACGVALIEKNRPTLGALVLAASGLAKETNILGAAALAGPEKNSLREWAKVGWRGILVILPLSLWAIALYSMLGPVGANTGHGAFGPPFAAMGGKLQLTLSELSQEGWGTALRSRDVLYALVSLAVQFVFLVSMPRLRNAWWRVGAAFAVLMIFLGPAVWEGYPGAASRVLLPMTLAFNVLVPRGPKWWLVLLLGNLTVLTSADLSRPPESLGYRLHAPTELRRPDRDGLALTVTFGPGWYGAERSTWDYWRWSRGNADLRIYNPNTIPVALAVDFTINAASDQDVRFGSDQGELWKGHVDRRRQKVRREQIILVPGENRLWWQTVLDEESSRTPSDDRRLVFRMYDLKLSVSKIPQQ